METLFDDDYINNKILKRLIKEIKREQISKTIRNMDYYCELRAQLNEKQDFTPSQNKELEALKNHKNARKNLQA